MYRRAIAVDNPLGPYRQCGDLKSSPGGYGCASRRSANTDLLYEAALTIWQANCYMGIVYAFVVTVDRMVAWNFESMGARGSDIANWPAKSYHASLGFSRRASGFRTTTDVMNYDIFFVARSLTRLGLRSTRPPVRQARIADCSMEIISRHLPQRGPRLVFRHWGCRV